MRRFFDRWHIVCSSYGSLMQVGISLKHSTSGRKGRRATERQVLGDFGKEKYMRWRVALFATGLSLVFTIPVAAQDSQSVVIQSRSAKPASAVQSGNTTIVFAPADSRDIDTTRLRTWQEFADTHSGIERALANNPSLINDPRYLRSHPDLNAFFQEHPDIKSAMADDPGNFAAIPPRPGE
jgi:hypothetical protein